MIKMVKTIISVTYSPNIKEMLKTVLIYVIHTSVKKDLLNLRTNHLLAIGPSLLSEREIAIIIDFIIKHINGREVSRVNPEKTRSYKTVTAEDRLDYFKHTTRKRNEHGHYKFWHK